MTNCEWCGKSIPNGRICSGEHIGVCDVCGRAFVLSRNLAIKHLDGQKISCCRACTTKLTKQVFQEKYGTDSAMQVPEFRDRHAHTVLSNYGVRSPLSAPEVLDKIKHTNIERYGVDNQFKSPLFQEKLKGDRLRVIGVEYPAQSPEIREKMRQTCLDKHGVSNYSKSAQYRAAYRATCLRKYGTEYSTQVPKHNDKRRATLRSHYGVDVPIKCPEIRQKILSTTLKNYGTKYGVLTPNCRKVSLPELYWGGLFDDNNVVFSREFLTPEYAYDFDVYDVLVEINPWFTHNSTFSPKGDPKSTDYHQQKMLYANNLGYRVIQVWDWDSPDKVIALLTPKTTIGARKTTLKEITHKEANSFLRQYHLQNGTKKSTCCLGLFFEDTLVEVMTFGKPRYNKKFTYELLRLCSHPDYTIQGGASKLFKHFSATNKGSIISYCDLSKFSGEIYTKLGFTPQALPAPSKHWYNPETDTHITNNLLLQRGADQLIGTHDGKGTNNEEIMIREGFVEIYDCGQQVFIQE
jgi:hypothetical protein